MAHSIPAKPQHRLGSLQGCIPSAAAAPQARCRPQRRPIHAACPLRAPPHACLCCPPPAHCAPHPGRQPALLPARSRGPPPGPLCARRAPASARSPSPPRRWRRPPRPRAAAAAASPSQHPPPPRQSLARARHGPRRPPLPCDCPSQARGCRRRRAPWSPAPPRRPRPRRCTRAHAAAHAGQRGRSGGWQAGPGSPCRRRPAPAATPAPCPGPRPAASPKRTGPGTPPPTRPPPPAHRRPNACSATCLACTRAPTTMHWRPHRAVLPSGLLNAATC